MMQNNPLIGPQTALQASTPTASDEDRSERSIASLFEEQVRLHPDRIAVTVGSRAVTYSALNGMANALAYALLSHAQLDERPVALLFGFGDAVVSAMFGVLKVGRFFFVLEPFHPEAQLQALLADSGAGVIVTDAKHQTLAVTLAAGQARVINLEALTPEASDPLVETAKSPDLLATMFYTSGSTGEPKAVLHSQRGLLHFAFQVTKTQAIGVNDHLTHLTSFSFLVATRHLYCSLLNGATLCLYDMRQEGIKPFAKWMREQEISIIHGTPTLFRHFAQSLGSEETFPSLRWIGLGGETISQQDVKLYQEHFSEYSRLRLTFASTEANFIAWHTADKESRFADGPLPVGYPVDGTHVELWDEYGGKVPDGQAGEVVVRSRYIAQGYWRQPELTTAHFLPDPAGGDERLFRTGDMGRLDEQGRLVHLGRKDSVVKIRGNRVEIAAIEAELTAMAAIKLAAVAAQEDSAGGRKLVAYLVVNHDAQLTVTDLRRHLNTRLPDYMVPARFVLLDKLPLTGTGKVDRQNLPTLSRQRPLLSVGYVAPQGEMATVLCELWANLLELDRVGVEDDFFDLGGDSILAMRLALRIEQQWQRSLPPAFFHKLTIAQLVTLWEEESGAPPPSLPPTTSPPLRHSPPSLLVRALSKSQNLLRQPSLARIYVRRVAEHALLPLGYPTALRWLRWWCEREAVRETFYREEQRWFREFAEGLGSTPATLNRAFVASMMGNILYDLTRMASLLPRHEAFVTFEHLRTSKYRFGRTLAQTIEASIAYQTSKATTVAGMMAETRDSNAHLITHVGFEHLQAAHQRGRGVLLATYHGSMHRIATVALAHRLQERDIFSVSQTNAMSQARRESRSNTTLPVAFREISAHTRIGIEGQRQLRQGAIVQLANDVGYEKSGTFPFTIGGRVFQLKPGFAELALNTRAAIVPHYATIMPTGEIINCFFPAIEGTSNPRTRQDQVMELFQLYVAFLEESWRQSPESLRWFVLKHYLSFPPASR